MLLICIICACALYPTTVEVSIRVCSDILAGQLFVQLPISVKLPAICLAISLLSYLLSSYMFVQICICQANLGALYLSSLLSQLSVQLSICQAICQTFFLASWPSVMLSICWAVHLSSYLFVKLPLRLCRGKRASVPTGPAPHSCARKKTKLRFPGTRQNRAQGARIEHLLSPRKCGACCEIYT